MNAAVKLAAGYRKAAMPLKSFNEDFVCVLPHPDEIVAIDFEASSLNGMGPDAQDHQMSYPIEVGIATSKGKTESFLIKPAEGWVDWSDDSEEEIHHISKDMLQAQGRDVRAVAEWLNERLAGKVVINDGPSAKVDCFWCNRLFKSAGIEQQFEIVNFFDLLGKNSEYYHNACIVLGYSPLHAVHRAGPDAENLMDIYKKSFEFYQQDLLDHNLDGHQHMPAA